VPARDRGSPYTLGTIVVLVFLLWDTRLVYPLKVLVVMFHELSHGAMAILTGGRIVEIAVTADQGGQCVTSGGIRFLTLSAGYLGSMAIGAALLVTASHSKNDRQIAAGLGVFLMAITLIYMKWSFGYAFGMLAGASLIFSARSLSVQTNDLVLKTIGVTSCLYAILDIKSDIFDRSGIGSDAEMLAQHTRIPAIIWGVLWILLAVVATGFALLVSVRSERRS
jgi:hypothetical protein